MYSLISRQGLKKKSKINKRTAYIYSGGQSTYLESSIGYLGRKVERRDRRELAAYQIARSVLIYKPSIVYLRLCSGISTASSHSELVCEPRYSTTDPWIQESIKRIINSRLFWAVGAAEKKKANCHKYATFEVSFLCFHGQKKV